MSFKCYLDELNIYFTFLNGQVRVLVTNVEMKFNAILFDVFKHNRLTWHWKRINLTRKDDKVPGRNLKNSRTLDIVLPK
jgi:hypothetical protein